jgi:hypothetical protein
MDHQFLTPQLWSPDISGDRGGADSPEATVLVRFIAIHRLVMAIIMVSNGE